MEYVIFHICYTLRHRFHQINSLIYALKDTSRSEEMHVLNTYFSLSTCCFIQVEIKVIKDAFKHVHHNHCQPSFVVDVYNQKTILAFGYPFTLQSKYVPNLKRDPRSRLPNSTRFISRFHRLHTNNNKLSQQH